MGLRTPMNPQQLNDILNLPVDQDPSEQLTNLLHHQDQPKLQVELFRTIDYHLNNTQPIIPQNPQVQFKTHCEHSHSNVKIGVTYSKDVFMYRKLFVLNYRFSSSQCANLVNFYARIKKRTVWNYNWMISTKIMILGVWEPDNTQNKKVESLFGTPCI